MKLRGLATAFVIGLGVAIAQPCMLLLGAERYPAQTPAKAKMSLQDVWLQILNSRDDLEMTIAKKRLGMVEIYGFRIAGLANELSTLSTNLPPEKMETLKQHVQKVQQLGSDLDKTGDSNDLPGTKANVKRLDEVLGSIRLLYPEGTLPDRPSEKVPEKSPTGNSR